MDVDKKKNNSKKVSGKGRAAEIADVFEWLITAFILALIFRAFVMEAFRIPTGSMADTLNGAHFRLRCEQCGYRYDRGFVPERYNLPEDTIVSSRLRTRSRCPSCGFYQVSNIAPVNGDRILVLKWIYYFSEPCRWDVIVFKNPLQPSINYVKRLIALPGETVEIIDGDIYIDGRIRRKPEKVQAELWMPVYDNDYQPVRPSEPFFNSHKWRQPFQNQQGSHWQFSKDNPVEFSLDSAPDRTNWLVYNTSVGNDFKAAYAYNSPGQYDSRPYCSDLMTRFYVRTSGPAGRIGILLSKYNRQYCAYVDFEGNMFIEQLDSEGNVTALAARSAESSAADTEKLLKFANVDHKLVFCFGSERLTYDIGSLADDAGFRAGDIEPQVKIFGSGRLTISHTAIFRDIYYTQVGGSKSRAAEGRPFTLDEDEFFVLGDNSPHSADGRWWNQPGLGNNGLQYRRGVVPRDYLVGKALWVYWPSGFRIFPESRFAVVPNFGELRFIYGGSGKQR